jgi:hypothetical protein
LLIKSGIWYVVTSTFLPSQWCWQWQMFHLTSHHISQ